MGAALWIESVVSPADLRIIAVPAKTPFTVWSWRRKSAGGTAPTAGGPKGLDAALNSPARLAWEASVLERCRRGDSRALGELYDAYAEAIFVRVLLPKLGDAAAAEDALADTFRAGLLRLDDFEARGTSIYFWLSRIATNKAMDHHRRDGSRARALSQLEQRWAQFLDQPETPEEAISGKQVWLNLRAHLQERLDSLNPRYRLAIELRYYQELSREECAAQMGLRVGTFDVLLLRAVKSMRKDWDDGSQSGDTP